MTKRHQDMTDKQTEEKEEEVPFTEKELEQYNKKMSITKKFIPNLVWVLFFTFFVFALNFTYPSNIANKNHKLLIDTTETKVFVTSATLNEKVPEYVIVDYYLNNGQKKSVQDFYVADDFQRQYMLKMSGSHKKIKNVPEQNTNAILYHIKTKDKGDIITFSHKLYAKYNNKFTTKQKHSVVLIVISLLLFSFSTLDRGIVVKNYLKTKKNA